MLRRPVETTALSGHFLLHRACLLLEVKQTCLFALQVSAFDPKRTLGRPLPTLVQPGTMPCPELQATRTVPVVFTVVPDPVGAGLVKRLSRPGGNATGFMQFEYSLSGKWLELLKQIAPSVNRAAVFRDPAITAGIGQFAVIQSVAPSVGVKVSPINTNDTVSDIELAVADSAREPNGGLIATASASGITQRELIVSLAARHKLPAVYFNRDLVSSGGLISYGADFTDMYRRAASYVDRILKGEKPADLPVQAPNKYELVINLKTAKALGLTIPQSVLGRADEVIE